MNRYIAHLSDLNDLMGELKEIKLPYYVLILRQKPTDGDDKEKWKRLNSFFHRGVVPIYSHLSGLDEAEAKIDLQRMFATVREDEEHYIVESVGGMNLPRLMGFIEQCQTFLIKEFGVSANELIEMNRIKYLKTKTITK